jgi:hypothetical protein
MAPSGRGPCCRPDGPHRPLDLECHEFVLRRRQAEPTGVADRSMSVEQQQNHVLFVEKRLQDIVKPLHVAIERLSKSHGHNSPLAATDRTGPVFRASDDQSGSRRRPYPAAPDRPCAALAAERRAY